MEFRRLRIAAFGALRDLDTGPEPLPRLVVGLGPNEGGKSTLFGFLTSMLYGLYPASRERNPYTPWGGGDIEGRAELRMDDGALVEVHRRLLSSPAGTLTRGGTTEDLRNRTLPGAEHVPRQVFRQVFALTLAELAALEGESWERVQDRLVTGMGASDLASVRDAAEQLEREAGRLWRPTRMGHQEVRDLEERLRELRMKRRAAADADRKLREAARERSAVAAELGEARREREACHLYVERCQTLLPVRDRLRRIDELRREAGDLGELDGLPADPDARLAELDDELRRAEERCAALEAEAVEPEARIRAFGGRERAALERADEIRDAVARAAAMEPLRGRAAQLEQETRDLERRCEDTARELLEGSWKDIDAEVLRSVPTGRLRRALERHRDARESRRLAEQAAHARPSPAPRPLPRFLGPCLAVAGVAILAVSASGGGVAAAIVGALLTGVGGALTLVERLHRPPSPEREAELPRERLDRARAAEADARSEVDALLSGLPLRPELRESPTADVGGLLQRLQDLVGDHGDRVEQLADVRRTLDAARADLRGLASELDPGGSSGTGVTAHRLEALLREAESARDAAASADRELARIGRDRTAAAERRAEVRQLRDALGERLDALARPAADGLWAAHAVRDRLEARDRARRLEEELEREHTDLDELRRRIRRLEASGEEWSLDADTLAARRAREKELGGRIEELARRIEGLEKDMDYLRRGDTVDAVEGEMEATQREIAEAIRARDRLWVLGRLLREADRRFRDEHQPDVLRRAGCHLSSITGGRYHRILLDDAGEGRFHLDGPGYPGPVEVGEPISTGTREQVYLALRLAVLDHLDRNGERLPVFMDEAFVNWDQERRERGFGLLEEVARTRQVFVFTCHEDMAGSLAARGARVLVLDAGS